MDYELTVVDMLRKLSRTTTRDAIEEYCRSYLEEEGLQQAGRADIFGPDMIRRS